MTYKWQFGDGDSSVATSPSKTYSTSDQFWVNLTAVSNHGCTGSTGKFIEVLPQPAASFNIVQDSQCLSGNVYSFKNTSTLSSGYLMYHWDFNN